MPEILFASDAVSLHVLARKMWQMVNAIRANPHYRHETGGRARPLQWNARLARVARAHSEYMRRRQELTHLGPHGWDPGRRMRHAGLAWSAYAENVALANGIRDAMRLFMEEPPFQPNHRANILNPLYSEIGIGIVRAPHGQIYITQDFLRPAERTGKAPRARSRLSAAGWHEPRC